MVPPSSVPMAPAPPPVPRPQQGGAMRVVLGLVLLAPAVLFALTSLIIPTGQTILHSFQRGSPFRRGGPGIDGEFTGVDNYTGLFSTSDFWTALGFTVILAVIPMLVAVVVAPLLAGALDFAGTWPRRVGRVLMSVPLVVFAPVAVAASWQLALRDGSEMGIGRLDDPFAAQSGLVVISGLTTFGAVCGLAMLGYLAVLRGRGPGRRVLPAALAVGVIAALATFAVSLQSFSLVYIMTRGGPRRSTLTLAQMQMDRSFMGFDFGYGSAVASVTGLILGILGVAATLIAIIAALRIDFSPPDRSGSGGRPTNPLGTVLAAVGLLIVLAVVVIGAWPWLQELFSFGSGDSPGPTPPSPAGARMYFNTWAPPLLGAIVAVGVAFLAALGIGGLRPAGRRSEWLLLPFAPWLFVGIGPLSVADFENLRELDLINTFPGLVPPMLICVPALVVLTLFCRSREPVWQAQVAAGAPAGMSFLSVVVLPALPLAAFFGGAMVLINAQGLLWPLLVATDRSHSTATVTLVNVFSRYAVADLSVGFVTPIVVVIVVLLALGAFQILYLDRLAITTDRGQARPPAPAPGMPMPYPAAQPPPGPAPSPTPPSPAPPSDPPPPD